MTQRFLAAGLLSLGLLAAAGAAAQTPVPGTTTVIPSAGAAARAAPDSTASTGANVLGPGKDSPGPAGQMGGSGGTSPASGGSSLGGAPAGGGADTIRTR